MCGIGGILFSKSGGALLAQRIGKLAGAQSHRGPDDQQVLLMDNHALCHQRLSLIDHQGGKQPLYDPSGRYIMVYNGEVYNYEALRRELADVYLFTTHTDTEVVLAAYLVWGEACLHRFIGMFSFLIWDTLTETAFAARDPLGVKPFVFYTQGNEFVFASEVKAIVASLQQQLKVNPVALAEYVVAPMLSGVEDTILDGVLFLGAGEKLWVSKEGLKRSIYYNYTIDPSTNGFEQQVASLRHELRESTYLALKADVSVGSFFSGGLDSSILTAFARQLMASGMTAYTIKFQDHDQINFDEKSIVNADDFPFAVRMAEDLSFPLTPVDVDAGSILNSLRVIARVNDRVPAWEQEISQHFLSASASKTFKAVLVGDAADETHYGYFFLLNEKVNFAPLGLMSLFGGEKRSELLSDQIRTKLKPLAFFDDKYTQLVQNDGFNFKGNRKDKIRAMSCLVYKRWLGRLLHNGDIHSMNFGLEARVPFANLNVLKVAAGIDPEMGFMHRIEKHMLKAAAKGVVPDYIINRRKSALPRDPRMGPCFQKALGKLIQEERDFVADFLNISALNKLCELKKLEETDRMIIFNMLSLLNWVHNYAK